MTSLCALKNFIALSTNGFNTTTDAAAIEAEAGKLLTRYNGLPLTLHGRAMHCQSVPVRQLALGEMVVAWLSKLLILQYRRYYHGTRYSDGEGYR